MVNKVINKLFYKEAIWGIGSCNIRCIDNIKDIQDKFNQVISYKDIKDVKAIFLADPFVIKKDNTWYMFFEVYKANPRKGVIGLAISNDGVKWEYKKIVLEEDFHLSYPYIFEDKGKIYMIPESGESGFIKLYEAINFPYKWRCIKNIIKGEYYDSSILKYDEKWWIFSKSKIPKKNSLSLFYSDNLLDGWKEHCKSPIVCGDPRISRPGGRVFNDGDKIVRFSQDNSQYYGKSVIGFEIMELTTKEYKEEEIGVIIRNSDIKNSWNKDGMHTIEINKDKNRFFVISDGFYYKKVCKLNKDLIKRFLRIKGME